MRILLQASFLLGVRPLLRQRGGVVKMLRMSALHIWLTHFLRFAPASCLQSDTLFKLSNHFPACFAPTYLLFVTCALSAIIQICNVLLQTPTSSACIGHYTGPADAACELSLSV